MKEYSVYCPITNKTTKTPSSTTWRTVCPSVLTDIVLRRNRLNRLRPACTSFVMTSVSAQETLSMPSMKISIRLPNVWKRWNVKKRTYHHIFMKTTGIRFWMNIKRTAPSMTFTIIGKKNTMIRILTCSEINRCRRFLCCWSLDSFHMLPSPQDERFKTA